MTSAEERLQMDLDQAQKLLNNWFSNPESVMARYGINAAGEAKAEANVAAPNGIYVGCSGCGCFLVEMRFRT